MKKTVLLTVSLLSTIWAFAQNSKIVTEVVIYKFAESNNFQFDTLLLDFRNKVSRLKGYKNYITLQDKNNTNVYIDILQWGNISNAISASNTVKNEETFKPFTTSIDSLIAYGEFYSFKSFTNNKLKIKMTNKVSEVVVYQLKADKVSVYSNIADTTNNFLKTQKGFISRKIMQDNKDSTIFIDIVEWETVEDAQSAMQASQQEKSLIPFFEATEKVITFSHYTFYK
ncbi:MAG: hypothetical protein ABL929_02690 [Ferruginibacter sp.]|nr:hypothetical protein [Ferruginibacter sp.]